MNKVILIDCSLTFTKIGVVYENQLEQLYLQNKFEQDLQNRVIQGQITDIVKNLEAVFVDFGTEKNGLLHFKQIPECYKSRLRQGQRLPVQVMRENVGAKGHKLTAFVNIQGKHLVCLPFEQEVSVSKKIKVPEERMRLKKWIKEQGGEKYGFIVRTSGSSASEEELLTELLELIKQADQLMATKDNLSKGSVLIEDKSFALKIILDNITKVEGLKIICNDDNLIDEIKDNLEKYASDMKHEYVLLSSLENVFKFYDVEKQFSDTLKKKVWLKNGGNLVIEPTEAMTVIDVNSAKAIIKKNHDKSIMQINALAIEESIKQMIRRNISGMIIIDLIELKDKKSKQDIYEYAVECLKQLDGGRSTVYPITELGLLQISRTKRYTSLYHSIYSDCSCCGAIGGEYKAAYMTYLIEAKIKHILLNTTNNKLFIKCKTSLYDYIMQNELVNLLQKTYSIEIELTRETKEQAEKFNITYHIS